MSPRAPSEPVYVALGSNLGDRAAHLAFARARLDTLPGTRVVAASRIEQTAPLGPGPQAPYLNQMLRLETTLDPRELLDRMLTIEAAAGRVRAAGARWAPRSLDLDIVRFGNREVRDPGLTIPHPELPHRAFWQRELAELEVVP
ncbi:MAG: 2-amino-4-hydroxy-6-hydroxymethyldihydropteridine diphosphokinase [Gemmatimonadales bacterium]